MDKKGISMNKYSFAVGKIRPLRDTKTKEHADYTHDPNIVGADSIANKREQLKTKCVPASEAKKGKR
jgi:hypothetical protein